MGEAEFGLPWVGGGYGDLDAAHREADLGADFEEAEADGAAGGVGELGVGEADPAQSTDQGIGEGSEVEPELVGFHGSGTGAAGPRRCLLARLGRVGIP